MTTNIRGEDKKNGMMITEKSIMLNITGAHILEHVQTRLPLQQKLNFFLQCSQLRTYTHHTQSVPSTRIKFCDICSTHSPHLLYSVYRQRGLIVYSEDLG